MALRHQWRRKIIEKYQNSGVKKMVINGNAAAKAIIGEENMAEENQSKAGGNRKSMARRNQHNVAALA
jgi:hypothetical protein